MQRNIKIILFCLIGFFICENSYSQILRKPSTIANARSFNLINNLNNGLNIANPGTTPIYLITLTRQGAGEISVANWTAVQNVLRDLCGDANIAGPALPASMTGVGMAGTATVDLLNGMKNKCKVVVFSEYFFKKLTNSGALTAIAPNPGNIESGLVPLTKGNCETYITQLSDISTNCLKTIFYPNFLCFRPFVNPADIAIKNIYDAKPRMNSASQKKLVRNDAGDVRFVIMNITASIFNGKLLTEYKKSSYFNEANDFIEMNKTKSFFGTITMHRYAGIYDFGDGSDKIISFFTQPTAVAWDGVVHGRLQDVLLQNISTEICFDLAQKVRNSNGWSNTDNHQAQLHILQSNTIDPIGRTYENDNINNLPRNRLILHSDANFDVVNRGIGSRLFKINETGAPVLFTSLFDLTVIDTPAEKIKITIYRVSN